ncbi:DUF2237 domain-containing protein [Blastococcus sp. CT_GayMR19]|nr:DUF2237 domain-containing protein [Blastococcus sp. CT_GayMR19]
MVSGVGRQRTSGEVCSAFTGARCHPGAAPATVPPIHAARGASVQPEPADERNVLGGPLEPCGVDPVTGFYRDGHCTSGPEDLGSHTVCSVVSAEFLALQRELGNDLVTPRPEYGFPGLKPGDRWCVVAIRWLQAYQAGTATGVVLAATNARALDIVPLEALRQHAVDVPDDVSGLE